MECPKCKDIEMILIMEEANGNWWKCTKCGVEIIKPDKKPNNNHHNPFRMED